jgi:hypothetical protein
MPRSKSRSVRRSALARKRISGRTGKQLSDITIPIKPKLYKALGEETMRIKDLIETYGKAIEKSRRIDRPVRFSVEVRGGSPKIESIAGKSALDKRVSAKVRNPKLEDALRAARARGQGRVADILRGRDMLSAEAFAELLGTTRVTVNAKRKNRQVLALEGATRGFRFPHWQVGSNGRPYAALPMLFERLGDDAWAVYRFLMQRHPELDGLTGREALDQGKTEQAIEAAESIARGPG